MHYFCSLVHISRDFKGHVQGHYFLQNFAQINIISLVALLPNYLCFCSLFNCNMEIQLTVVLMGILIVLCPFVCSGKHSMVDWKRVVIKVFLCLQTFFMLKINLTKINWVLLYQNNFLSRKSDKSNISHL